MPFPTLQKLLILEHFSRSYGNILRMNLGIINFDEKILVFSHINGPGALARFTGVGTVYYLLCSSSYFSFSATSHRWRRVCLTPCSISFLTYYSLNIYDSYDLPGLFVSVFKVFLYYKPYHSLMGYTVAMDLFLLDTTASTQPCPVQKPTQRFA